MSFCCKCGNNIPEGSSFCNVCGTPLRAVPQQAAQPAAMQQPQMQQPYVQPAPQQAFQQSAAPQPERKRMGDNAGIRMLMPVGRSGFAIAAGYLGLCSFIPLMGILAIIFGIIAIIDIQTHPHRHGMGRAIFALIAGIAASIIYAVVLFS